MAKCGPNSKRRYTSQTAAVAGAFGLIERGRDVGHRPLNVYRCDQCGDWHVGHRPLVLPKKTAKVEPALVITDDMRCVLQCRKLAVETVITARGEFRCCEKHAKRLKAARAAVAIP